MRNDSKSGLCISHVITTVITILVISILAQLVIRNENNTQMAELEKVENTQEENENSAIQIAQTTSERQVNTTSRTSAEREIADMNSLILEELTQKENYISIDEIAISKDMDLTKRTGISKEDFKVLMSNSKKDSSGFFEENSDIIYDVCEKYEINEIFFCGLIAAESGWNIASNHRRTNNYISMMSGGRLISYSTVEEGLETAAKLLHDKYLTEGGSCYYGKTLSCVQKRFCPNSSTWVNLVYTCMNQVF